MRKLTTITGADGQEYVIKINPVNGLFKATVGDKQLQSITMKQLVIDIKEATKPKEDLIWTPYMTFEYNCGKHREYHFTPSFFAWRAYYTTTASGVHYGCAWGFTEPESMIANRTILDKPPVFGFSLPGKLLRRWIFPYNEELFESLSMSLHEKMLTTIVESVNDALIESDLVYPPAEQWVFPYAEKSEENHES